MLDNLNLNCIDYNMTGILCGARSSICPVLPMTVVAAVCNGYNGSGQTKEESRSRR